MKEYRTIVMVIVLALIAIPVMAQGPRFWQGERPGDCPRWERDWEGRGYGPAGLELTQEQRDQIRKLRDAHIEKTRPLRDEMQKNMQELQTQMNSNTPDEKKIWDTQKRISSLRDQLQQERIRHQLSVKKVAPEANFRMNLGKGYGWYSGRRGCMGI
ncbi:MAG TPA: Spy/CpxP family protein refolding chaperone [Deltaproteobacteria bacterium]|nr:Spy/CpxP family protein refolding chaperone [Deltaproteobacteria bacterium]HQI80604.1 Spy/CpxP family protein refolding chaperone [Deltaproteobacteria bacterium]